MFFSVLEHRERVYYSPQKFFQFAVKFRHRYIIVHLQRCICSRMMIHDTPPTPDCLRRLPPVQCPHCRSPYWQTTPRKPRPTLVPGVTVAQYIELLVDLRPPINRTEVRDAWVRD